MTLKTKILIMVSVGIAVLAALVFMLFFYQARLTIIPTPTNAIILISGQPIAAGTPIKLSPGTYNIEVSSEGYLTTTQSVGLGVSQVIDLAIELRQIPTIQTFTGGVKFPTMTTDGGNILYLGRDGKQFFKVSTNLDASGNAKVDPITTERFSDIKSVYWSADRSLVLYQTNAGATKLFDFKRYDFLSQEEKDFGSTIKNLTWNPSENQFIAFESTTGGDRSLIRKNILSDQTDRLIDLRAYNLTNPSLSWSPDGRTVAVLENALYLFDINTRSLKQIADTTNVKNASWAPESDKLLLEFDGSLSILTIADSAIAKLDIGNSIVKSTWTKDGQHIVTAVATDQNKDVLFDVEVESATKSRYSYKNDQPVLMDNLILDDDQKTIWFTNRETLSRLVLEKETLAL